MALSCANIMRSPLMYRAMSTKPPYTAYIGIGSNIGNRAKTIHAGIEELKKECRVLRTSFLYESAPMYVTNQPPFLNGSLQIQTTLSPLQLLESVKKIEKRLGRSSSAVRYGPRPLDLDIICYSEQQLYKDDVLQIPHARLQEREFVLRPICDISPDILIPTESGLKSACKLLHELLLNEESALKRVTPLPSGRLLRWGERTLLMGIINSTPDSFSDGGENNTITSAVKQVDKFSAQGFDIIDVGGQSTRPGSTPIAREEELARVLPVIQAIRQSFPQLMISCDTYVSEVAERALDAGADLINDISSGTLDKNMHATLARRNAACVQMHTRGTPATMETMQEYTDVTKEAANELLEHVERAQDEGVPRWNIITDMGVGFAKNGEQSVRMLAETERFRTLCGGYPTVVGMSRKSWLRGVTEMDSRSARDWGGAGAIAACVGRGGVDVARVHAAEVADAVRGADAIARGRMRCVR